MECFYVCVCELVIPCKHRHTHVNQKANRGHTSNRGRQISLFWLKSKHLAENLWKYIKIFSQNYSEKKQTNKQTKPDFIFSKFSCFSGLFFLLRGKKIMIQKTNKQTNTHIKKKHLPTNWPYLAGLSTHKTLFVCLFVFLWPNGMFCVGCVCGGCSARHSKRGPESIFLHSKWGHFDKARSKFQSSLCDYVHCPHCAIIWV